MDEPWAATLAAHLGHRDTGDEAEFRRGRRYAVARRLAGLFASYAAQRPQLLVDWSGRPADRRARRRRSTPTSPGSRRCGGRSPPPSPRRSRPVRHAATLARLEAGAERPAAAALPLRPHPDAVDRDRAAPRAGARTTTCTSGCRTPATTCGSGWPTSPGRRLARDDVSHRAVRHPLLASLGRDQRELQRSLGPAEHDVEVAGHRAAADTLLGRLQSDLRADAVRPAGRSHDPEDRSVQVHRCHGPARQVAGPPRGAARPARGRPRASSPATSS